MYWCTDLVNYFVPMNVSQDKGNLQQIVAEPPTQIESGKFFI